MHSLAASVGRDRRGSIWVQRKNRSQRIRIDARIGKFVRKATRRHIVRTRHITMRNLVAIRVINLQQIVGRDYEWRVREIGRAIKVTFAGDAIA